MSDLSTAKPAWLELLTQTSAVGVLLYAAGFLSLRTWLNLLGVWTGPPVIDQIYLAEGAQFSVATAEKLLFPWLLVTILVSVFIWLVLIALGGPRRRSLDADLRARFTRIPSWLAPLCALSVLAILALLIERVLLKPLETPQAILFATPRPSLAPPSDYQFCVGVVALAAVISVAVWKAVRLQYVGVLTRWCALCLFAFAAFLLPMDFARIAKARVAPVADITVKPGESEPADHIPAAFLLLATDKELVVHDGRSIKTFDRARVLTLRVECHASLLADPSCARSDPDGLPVRDSSDRPGAGHTGGSRPK